MKIYGLSGTFGSGKDTLAKALEIQKDFYHVSTSDIVREVCLKDHRSVDRKMLKIVANDYRDKYGGDYFAVQAYKRFEEQDKDYNGLVISGIRSVEEAEYVKSLGGKIVFLDAPIKVRYQRVKKRARDQEVSSFDDFDKSEAKERGSMRTDSAHQNLSSLADLADITIDNASEIDDFVRQSFQILGL